MNKKNVKFTLNGKPVTLTVSPSATLLDIIRDELKLTGTKKGCGKGECGACTVIMDGIAVNSCLVPIMKVAGCHVETIEGIGNKEKPHPVQEAFMDLGAIQCGFCTPGMIMSSKALLDKTPDPNREQIREAISGNICRCTGYVKIEAAVQAAADKVKEENSK
ncbi:(2Fe-2S)-binding protein [Desulfoscipio gibsoniae]|uniref:Aerobic-type carbon monoxide dehydrogenase, small subunit CoxS/CutS-like protein n=1 Tax=Desulfoscipio gibsoniae DSM 7213 TaxID=767817 RepID=R4KJV7_9FIRM|nr:(2Fe-2S)-binding protein [Desulfoscipio gibsoniae]AGL02914.1 aerobic-type carbon monoxide dehydrogenase, small subunit CoxS/CutS-like protein [Desulfoscipio gibsoniae DSM 7213]